MRAAELILGLWVLAVPAAGAEAVPAPGPAPMPEGSRLDLNYIQRPQELSFFYRKLRALDRSRSSHPSGRAVILHLGDSHLQSDELAQILRQGLRERFGDAGRGLVFPHSLARSTPSRDLLAESSVAWVARRAAIAPPKGYEDLEPGVSGWALLERGSPFWLRLGLRPAAESFDQAVVFLSRGKRAMPMEVGVAERPEALSERGLLLRERIHAIVPGDTLAKIARRYGVEVEDLRRWNRIKGERIYAGEQLKVGLESAPAEGELPGFKALASLPGGAGAGLSLTVRLAAPSRDLILRGVPKGEEDSAVLYGVSLERAGAPGLLYHVAACNGSQLKSFTQSRAFLDQARCLDPDLVIVSLGTNEANGEPQNLDEMEAALERLKGALTRGNPKYVAFLIATPPDSLTWKGRLNPRSQMTAARLRAYAEKHGLALWDWQGVMGGSGACLRWREAGLVWKDGVHMTPSGYKAQGRLLLGALMESYERF